MIIIRLTPAKDTKTEELCVNAEQIKAIWRNTPEDAMSPIYTKVQLVGDGGEEYWCVQETPSQILQEIAYLKSLDAGSPNVVK